MKLTQLLIELDKSYHVIDQFDKRLSSYDRLPVVLVTKEKKIRVGTFMFANEEGDIRSTIRKNYNKCYDYDYDPNISIGVLIYNFKLAKLDFKNGGYVYSENILWDTKEDKLKVDWHLNNLKGDIYLANFNQDKTYEDTGDTIQMIIRENSAITIMYGRKEKFNPQNLKVDVVVDYLSDLVKYAIKK